MDWATQKRLKYYILMVLIVVGILFAIALPIINRAPTCSDKKQNGDERGVDCGGSCQFVCQSDIIPLSVEWTRALPSGDKRVNVVAYVKNNNQTFAVPKADYKFTIYDSKGGIIQTFEGSTNIPANTVLPIFAGPVEIGERKVQSATFEWTSPFNFSNQTKKTLSSYIEVVDTKLEQATTTTHLTAQLRNTTRNEHRDVPVVAILYDEEENAALVSRTMVDVIGKEGTAEAVFFWGLPLNKKISKIEVVPVISDYR